MTTHHQDDARLLQALRALRQPTHVSSDLHDRILHDFREHAHVAPRRAIRWRLAAAIGIFAGGMAAGLLIGAQQTGVHTREAARIAAMRTESSADSARSISSIAATPVRAEVWY